MVTLSGSPSPHHHQKPPSPPDLESFQPSSSYTPECLNPFSSRIRSSSALSLLALLSPPPRMMRSRTFASLTLLCWARPQGSRSRNTLRRLRSSLTDRTIASSTYACRARSCSAQTPQPKITSSGRTITPPATSNRVLMGFPPCTDFSTRSSL